MAARIPQVTSRSLMSTSPRYANGPQLYSIDESSTVVSSSQLRRGGSQQYPGNTAVGRRSPSPQQFVGAQIVTPPRGSPPLPSTRVPPTSARVGVAPSHLAVAASNYIVSVANNSTNANRTRPEPSYSRAEPSQNNTVVVSSTSASSVHLGTVGIAPVPAPAAKGVRPLTPSSSYNAESFSGLQSAILVATQQPAVSSSSSPPRWAVNGHRAGQHEASSVERRQRVVRLPSFSSQSTSVRRSPSRVSPPKVTTSPSRRQSVDQNIASVTRPSASTSRPDNGLRQQAAPASYVPRNETSVLSARQPFIAAEPVVLDIASPLIPYKHNEAEGRRSSRSVSLPPRSTNRMPPSPTSQGGILKSPSRGHISPPTRELANSARRATFSIAGDDTNTTTTSGASFVALDYRDAFRSFTDSHYGKQPAAASPGGSFHPRSSQSPNRRPSYSRFTVTNMTSTESSMMPLPVFSPSPSRPPLSRSMSAPQPQRGPAASTPAKVVASPTSRVGSIPRANASGGPKITVVSSPPLGRLGSSGTTVSQPVVFSMQRSGSANIVVSSPPTTRVSSQPNTPRQGSATVVARSSSANSRTVMSTPPTTRVKVSPVATPNRQQQQQPSFATPTPSKEAQAIRQRDLGAIPGASQRRTSISPPINRVTPSPLRASTHSAAASLRRQEDDAESPKSSSYGSGGVGSGSSLQVLSASVPLVSPAPRLPEHRGSLLTLGDVGRRTSLTPPRRTSSGLLAEQSSGSYLSFAAANRPFETPLFRNVTAKPTPNDKINSGIFSKNSPPRRLSAEPHVVTPDVRKLHELHERSMSDKTPPLKGINLKGSIAKSGADSSSTSFASSGDSSLSLANENKNAASSLSSVPLSAVVEIIPLQPYQNDRSPSAASTPNGFLLSTTAIPKSNRISVVSAVDQQQPGRRGSITILVDQHAKALHPKREQSPPYAGRQSDPKPGALTPRNLSRLGAKVSNPEKSLSRMATRNPAQVQTRATRVSNVESDVSFTNSDVSLLASYSSGTIDLAGSAAELNVRAHAILHQQTNNKEIKAARAEKIVTKALQMARGNMVRKSTDDDANASISLLLDTQPSLDIPFGVGANAKRPMANANQILTPKKRAAQPMVASNASRKPVGRHNAVGYRYPDEDRELQLSDSDADIGRKGQPPVSATTSAKHEGLPAKSKLSPSPESRISKQTPIANRATLVNRSSDDESQFDLSHSDVAFDTEAKIDKRPSSTHTPVPAAVKVSVKNVEPEDSTTDFTSIEDEEGGADDGPNATSAMSASRDVHAPSKRTPSYSYDPSPRRVALEKINSFVRVESQRRAANLADRPMPTDLAIPKRTQSNVNSISADEIISFAGDEEEEAIVEEEDAVQRISLVAVKKAPIEQTTSARKKNRSPKDSDEVVSIRGDNIEASSYREAEGIEQADSRLSVMAMERTAAPRTVGPPLRGTENVLHDTLREVENALIEVEDVELLTEVAQPLMQPRGRSSSSKVSATPSVRSKVASVHAESGYIVPSVKSSASVPSSAVSSHRKHQSTNSSSHLQKLDLGSNERPKNSEEPRTLHSSVASSARKTPSTTFQPIAVIRQAGSSTSGSPHQSKLHTDHSQYRDPVPGYYHMVDEVGPQSVISNRRKQLKAQSASSSAMTDLYPILGDRYMPSHNQSDVQYFYSEGEVEDQHQPRQPSNNYTAEEVQPASDILPPLSASREDRMLALLESQMQLLLHQQGAAQSQAAVGPSATLAGASSVTSRSRSMESQQAASFQPSTDHHLNAHPDTSIVVSIAQESILPVGHPFEHVITRADELGLIQIASQQRQLGNLAPPLAAVINLPAVTTASSQHQQAMPFLPPNIQGLDTNGLLLPPPFGVATGSPFFGGGPGYLPAPFPQVSIPVLPPPQGHQHYENPYRQLEFEEQEHEVSAEEEEEVEGDTEQTKEQALAALDVIMQAQARSEAQLILLSEKVADLSNIQLQMSTARTSVPNSEPSVPSPSTAAQPRPLSASPSANPDRGDHLLRLIRQSASTSTSNGSSPSATLPSSVSTASTRGYVGMDAKTRPKRNAATSTKGGTIMTHQADANHNTVLLTSNQKRMQLLDAQVNRPENVELQTWRSDALGAPVVPDPSPYRRLPVTSSNSMFLSPISVRRSLGRDSSNPQQQAGSILTPIGAPRYHADVHTGLVDDLASDAARPLVSTTTEGTRWARQPFTDFTAENVSATVSVIEEQLRSRRRSADYDELPISTRLPRHQHGGKDDEIDAADGLEEGPFIHSVPPRRSVPQSFTSPSSNFIHDVNETHFSGLPYHHTYSPSSAMPSHHHWQSAMLSSSPHPLRPSTLSTTASTRTAKVTHSRSAANMNESAGINHLVSSACIRFALGKTEEFTPNDLPQVGIPIEDEEINLDSSVTQRKKKKKKGAKPPSGAPPNEGEEEAASNVNDSIVSAPKNKSMFSPSSFRAAEQHQQEDRRRRGSIEEIVVPRISEEPARNQEHEQLYLNEAVSDPEDPLSVANALHEHERRVEESQNPDNKRYPLRSMSDNDKEGAQLMALLQHLLLKQASAEQTKEPAPLSRHPSSVKMQPLDDQVKQELQSSKSSLRPSSRTAAPSVPDRKESMATANQNVAEEGSPTVNLQQQQSSHHLLMLGHSPDRRFQLAGAHMSPDSFAQPRVKKSTATRRNPLLSHRTRTADNDATSSLSSTSSAEFDYGDSTINYLGQHVGQPEEASTSLANNSSVMFVQDDELSALGGNSFVVKPSILKSKAQMGPAVVKVENIPDTDATEALPSNEPQGELSTDPEEDHELQAELASKSRKKERAKLFLKEKKERQCVDRSEQDDRKDLQLAYATSLSNAQISSFLGEIRRSQQQEAASPNTTPAHQPQTSNQRKKHRSSSVSSVTSSSVTDSSSPSMTSEYRKPTKNGKRSSPRDLQKDSERRQLALQLKQQQESSNEMQRVMALIQQQHQLQLNGLANLEQEERDSRLARRAAMEWADIILVEDGERKTIRKTERQKKLKLAEMRKEQDDRAHAEKEAAQREHESRLAREREEEIQERLAREEQLQLDIQERLAQEAAEREARRSEEAANQSAARDAVRQQHESFLQQTETLLAQQQEMHNQVLSALLEEKRADQRDKLFANESLARNAELVRDELTERSAIESLSVISRQIAAQNYRSRLEEEVRTIRQTHREELLTFNDLEEIDRYQTVTVVELEVREDLMRRREAHFYLTQAREERREADLNRLEILKVMVATHQQQQELSAVFRSEQAAAVEAQEKLRREMTEELQATAQALREHQHRKDPNKDSKLESSNDNSDIVKSPKDSELVVPFAHPSVSASRNSINNLDNSNTNNLSNRTREKISHVAQHAHIAQSDQSDEGSEVDEGDSISVAEPAVLPLPYSHSSAQQRIHSHYATSMYGRDEAPPCGIDISAIHMPQGSDQNFFSPNYNVSGYSALKNKNNLNQTPSIADQLTTANVSLVQPPTLTVEAKEEQSQHIHSHLSKAHDESVARIVASALNGIEEAEVRARQQVATEIEPREFQALAVTEWNECTKAKAAAQRRVAKVQTAERHSLEQAAEAQRAHILDAELEAFERRVLVAREQDLALREIQIERRSLEESVAQQQQSLLEGGSTLLKGITEALESLSMERDRALDEIADREEHAKRQEAEAKNNIIASEEAAKRISQHIGQLTSLEHTEGSARRAIADEERQDRTDFGSRRATEVAAALLQIVRCETSVSSEIDPSTHRSSASPRQDHHHSINYELLQANQADLIREVQATSSHYAEAIQTFATSALEQSRAHQMAMAEAFAQQTSGVIDSLSPLLSPERTRHEERDDAATEALVSQNRHLHNELSALRQAVAQQAQDKIERDRRELEEVRARLSEKEVALAKQHREAASAEESVGRQNRELEGRRAHSVDREQKEAALLEQRRVGLDREALVLANRSEATRRSAVAVAEAAERDLITNIFNDRRQLLDRITKAEAATSQITVLPEPQFQVQQLHQQETDERASHFERLREDLLREQHLHQEAANAQASSFQQQADHQRASACRDQLRLASQSEDVKRSSTASDEREARHELLSLFRDGVSLIKELEAARRQLEEATRRAAVVPEAYQTQGASPNTHLFVSSQEGFPIPASNPNNAPTAQQGPQLQPRDLSPVPEPEVGLTSQAAEDETAANPVGVTKKEQEFLHRLDTEATAEYSQSAAAFLQSHLFAIVQEFSEGAQAVAAEAAKVVAVERAAAAQHRRAVRISKDVIEVRTKVTRPKTPSAAPVMAAEDAQKLLKVPSAPRLHEPDHTLPALSPPFAHTPSAMRTRSSAEVLSAMLDTVITTNAEHFYQAAAVSEALLGVLSATLHNETTRSNSVGPQLSEGSSSPPSSVRRNLYAFEAAGTDTSMISAHHDQGHYHGHPESIVVEQSSVFEEDASVIPSEVPAFTLPLSVNVSLTDPMTGKLPIPTTDEAHAPTSSEVNTSTEMASTTTAATTMTSNATAPATPPLDTSTVSYDPVADFLTRSEERDARDESASAEGAEPERVIDERLSSSSEFSSTSSSGGEPHNDEFPTHARTQEPSTDEMYIEANQEDPNASAESISFTNHSDRPAPLTLDESAAALHPDRSSKQLSYSSSIGDVANNPTSPARELCSVSNNFSVHYFASLHQPMGQLRRQQGEQGDDSFERSSGSLADNSYPQGIGSHRQFQGQPEQQPKRRRFQPVSLPQPHQAARQQHTTEGILRSAISAPQASQAQQPVVNGGAQRKSTGALRSPAKVARSPSSTSATGRSTLSNVVVKSSSVSSTVTTSNTTTTTAQSTRQGAQRIPLLRRPDLTLPPQNKQERPAEQIIPTFAVQRLKQPTAASPASPLSDTIGSLDSTIQRRSRAVLGIAAAVPLSGLTNIPNPYTSGYLLYKRKLTGGGGNLNNNNDDLPSASHDQGSQRTASRVQRHENSIASVLSDHWLSQTYEVTMPTPAVTPIRRVDAGLDDSQ